MVGAWYDWEEAEAKADDFSSNSFLQLSGFLKILKTTHSSCIAWPLDHQETIN